MPTTRVPHGSWRRQPDVVASATPTLAITRVLDAGAYYYVLQWNRADYAGKPDGYTSDALLTLEPGPVGEDLVAQSATTWTYLRIPDQNVVLGARITAKGAAQLYTLRYFHFNTDPRLEVINPLDIV